MPQPPDVPPSPSAPTASSARPTIRFNPRANELPVWLPDVEIPAGIMPRRGEPLPPSDMERTKAEYLSKMILGLPLQISGAKTPQTLDLLDAFAIRRIPNA